MLLQNRRARRQWAVQPQAAGLLPGEASLVHTFFIDGRLTGLGTASLVPTVARERCGRKGGARQVGRRPQRELISGRPDKKAIIIRFHPRRRRAGTAR